MNSTFRTYRYLHIIYYFTFYNILALTRGQETSRDSIVDQHFFFFFCNLFKNIFTVFTYSYNLTLLFLLNLILLFSTKRESMPLYKQYNDNNINFI